MLLLKIEKPINGIDSMIIRLLKNVKKKLCKRVLAMKIIKLVHMDLYMLIRN